MRHVYSVEDFAGSAGPWLASRSSGLRGRSYGFAARPQAGVILIDNVGRGRVQAGVGRAMPAGGADWGVGPF